MIISGSGEEKIRRALRLNALLAGTLGMVATVLLFWGNLPFPRTVAWFSLVSAVCYFVYVLVFDLVCRNCYRAAGIALSQFGAVIVSIAVYYTGGVVSPLPFLYMAMLVSEAIYGLENNYTLPVCAAGYLAAVWGIYFGFLPNPTPWAAAANTNPLFLTIISLLLVAYLSITKNLSELVVSNLRSVIESESIQKDVLLSKFSELNSTAQLGVLAHRIAHDLRGPITAVSGYLEIETATAASQERKAELLSISKAVDGMVESLHGITRFGKPGGPSAEKIVLAGFLRDLLAIAAFSPQARWVKFVPRYAPDSQAATVGSRADLQQAFFNILKNAVESVSENNDGKTVELDISVAGKEILVSISDNGPGVPEEILKDVFRKSVTTKKRGTGVGLMITRDLLRRNGGDIKLRNRPEGGLTVAVSLQAS